MPDAIIGQIDEKLFICGVDALYNVTDNGSGKKVWMAAADRLRELNITHIMNIAEEHIYSPGPGESDQHSADVPLVEQLRSATELHILGADDVDTQDLSQYFEQITAFLAEGREAGGAVVHCRQGHSRGATGALCYLVIGRKLSLNAAFEKVHRIRSQIKPNAGFWRQLRELEASLLKQGVELQENPTGAISDAERTAAQRIIREMDQRDLGQRYMALSKTTMVSKAGPGANRQDSRQKMEEIALRVGRLLVARGESVAVPESAYAGVIAEAFRAVPNAASFLKSAAADAAADAAELKEESLVRQAHDIRAGLNATWGLSAFGNLGDLASIAAASGGGSGLAAAPTGAKAAQPAQAVLAIAGDTDKRTRKLKTDTSDSQQNLLIIGCSTLDLFEQALQDSPSSAAAGKSKL